MNSDRQINVLPNGRKKLFVILGLLVFFVVVGYGVWLTKPSVVRGGVPLMANVSVVVQLLREEDISATISSYGIVAPLTQATLVSRVSGVIEMVSADIRDGGFFQQGQLLLTLDQADYLIELDIAKAQVAEAQSRYITELALAEEAKHDWARSGRKGDAPVLALRKPQLSAAKAALQSARAAVKRSELNLERTKIYAPYRGRVLNLHVGEGQLVSPGTALADVYATDAAEISLPIKSAELSLLDLRALEQHGVNTPSVAASKVVFRSQLTPDHEWRGELVRISGAVDAQSRQLQVVARIGSPFISDASTQGASLHVGEYLTAQITGRILTSTMAIPNTAIYQGRYVYVHREGKVYRRDISIGWSDSERSIVEAGLQVGEELVLTALGRVPSGTLVEVIAQGANKAEGEHSVGAAKAKKHKQNKKENSVPRASL
ncbi:MAG: efflux transporter periplasmic adaptor subunit [Alteromonadaceae bacterium]|nr:MAG: efflux transporter periplasmic adaptor subunit [Alteromonadaceae bacterium]